VLGPFEAQQQHEQQGAQPRAQPEETADRLGEQPARRLQIGVQAQQGRRQKNPGILDPLPLREQRRRILQQAPLRSKAQACSRASQSAAGEAVGRSSATSPGSAGAASPSSTAVWAGRASD
jgi:hypothetical protein